MAASGGAPKAHIMAAGMGTRLAPLTDRTAKPMAPIVNRPVMEHILRLLARHGVTEVCINLHHYADDIRGYFGDGRAFGLNAHYSFEEKLLGTAGGTGGFRELLGDDTFLVVSGDALTDVDISSFVAAHCAHGGIATIAVKEVDDPSHYGVVVHDADGRVTGFQEKPAAADALSRLCNCGIYAFEPAIFDLIPPGAFCDYAKDIFPRLLADDEPFHVWRLETYWNDVGSLREYRRGNFDALRGRVAVSMPGRELRLGVWVGDDTEVADDVEIVPPVLIGDGCRVAAQAKLIGPLVIGDGCTIGHGAVLEGVIHWNGTATGHRAALAGGIVGRAVRIGDDAVVHRGAVIGDGCVVCDGAVVKADARLGPQTAVDAVPAAPEPAAPGTAAPEPAAPGTAAPEPAAPKAPA
jgi:NDP-sugar pyrophosphorylase family protein